MDTLRRGGGESRALTPALSQGERGPAGEALLAAACALRPDIEAAADAIERERKLPESLVAAMYDAGLFGMLLPASLGGSELDLVAFVRAIEELARADGSVAWCVGQACGLGAYAAYFDPGVARAIFLESGRRAILANGPGEGNQPGKAVPDGHGYRITGRWAFASGCLHATWLLAICHLQTADGRPRFADDAEPELRLMLLPIEQATILDTWHVSGLRGTGSQTFVVDGLHVPEERCVLVADSTRREQGPLYLFTSAGMFGPAFASVALGLAESTLGAALDLASGKTPRGAMRTVRESATVQAALARARARLSAARLFLHHTLDEVWAFAARNHAVDVGERVRVRLAATHAIHEAADVVDIAYELAGSHAIFANGPFERRFRDVHAVTQQLQGRAAHFETVGRYLVGLDPASPFL
jgi:alkylation response protein AidB-like acyl-CoA dehydrogenase